MTITPTFDQPPPCMGKHTLFDSRLRADHLKAKKLCDVCPVFAACWDNLQAVRNAPSHLGGAPEGTWAGLHINPERSHKPCGTIAAFSRHKYRGEKPCDPCREAFRKNDREKKRKPVEGDAA